MNKLKNKKQFILFCLVGIFNTISGLSLYFILHQALGLPTYVSSPLTVLWVMTISYILNAKFVFHNSLSFLQYLKFIFFTGVCIIIIQTSISTLFEKIAQDFLMSIRLFKNEEFNIFLANSIVRTIGVAFSLLLNFTFYKYFIFRDNNDEKAPVNNKILH